VEVAVDNVSTLLVIGLIALIVGVIAHSLNAPSSG
jgi:hypothetical protein